MKSGRVNKSVLASVAACSMLIGIGLLRLASYSHGGLGDVARGSILGVIAYNPDSLASAQFFKILATPVVVAGVYFFFRWRNVGRPSSRLDFKSPLLRGVLTTVITLHWVVMEWWKFNVEGFYPWSPLEGRVVNIAVLLASQAVAFLGMKYLSFEPIYMEDVED